jgi:hypothetical protein
VLGGKGHEFGLDPRSVFPGDPGQARDGAPGDLDEACGLADAVVFGEVLQYGEGLFLWEA